MVKCNDSCTDKFVLVVGCLSDDFIFYILSSIIKIFSFNMAAILIRSVISPNMTIWYVCSNSMPDL